MKIGYSAAAVGDLAVIGANGQARFGKTATDVYLARLYRSISVIAENPQIAHLRTEVRRPVRIHSCGAHVIVYEIADGQIQIVRILSSRQNWVEHL